MPLLLFFCLVRLPYLCPLSQTCPLSYIPQNAIRALSQGEPCVNKHTIKWRTCLSRKV